MASQSGKEPDKIVEELVASHPEHDAWFRQEVGKGLTYSAAASLFPTKTVVYRVRHQMLEIGRVLHGFQRWPGGISRNHP